MSRAEAWSWLCRVSWNPLFGSVLGAFFAGLFALFGAVIGGRYVLRSIRDQREFEKLAAGRAVSAELEMNIAGTATLAVAGKIQPVGYLVSRPPLLRAAFDDRLTLMSELLEPSEFLALVSLYARASASFALLESQARRGAEFTPGAIKQFCDHAKEFAIAAKALANRVWPANEQMRLETARNQTLRELQTATCGTAESRTPRP